MSLLIDVTPEVETRLQEEAHKRGLQPREYAGRLLEGFLLPTQADDEQEAARLDAINNAVAALAHTSFSSNDLAREHQEEIECDERLFQEGFGRNGKDG